MNAAAVIEALYVNHRALEQLGGTLAAKGFTMAAEEVRREAYALGCRISQIDGVIDDYNIDIAAATLKAEA